MDSVSTGTLDSSSGHSGLTWTRFLVPATAGWIAARVCVALGVALSHVTVDRLDNPGGRASISEGLFIWDGAYYRSLADVWYSGANHDAARFFPLYPGLARVISPLFGGNHEMALLVLSNLAALVAAMLLGQLAYEVMGNTDRAGGAVGMAGQDMAIRSVWMVAVFPSAFVMVFAYTESLALLVTVTCLLALHRRWFVTAGSAALLASLLRPVGGLLLVPIVIEIWSVRPRPAQWRIAIAAAAPVVGLGAAFVWISRSTGDLLLPWTLQQQIRGGFQDPVTRVLEPIGEIAKGNFRDVYNFGFMVVLLLLFYLAVRFRQPLSWLAFTATSLVILLSSQVTDSLGRYGLLLIPLIIAAAQWADTRSKQFLYAASSSLAMIWLVSEVMIGRMVP